MSFHEMKAPSNRNLKLRGGRRSRRDVRPNRGRALATEYTATRWRHEEWCKPSATQEPTPFNGSESELENIIRTTLILGKTQVSPQCNTAVRSLRYRCRRISTHDTTGTTPQRSYSVNKIVITGASSCVARAALLEFAEWKRLTKRRTKRMLEVEVEGKKLAKHVIGEQIYIRPRSTSGPAVSVNITLLPALPD